MFTKIKQWFNHSGTSKNTAPTLEKQVQDTLAAGHPLAALQLLIDADYAAAVPLKAQLEEAQQQFQQKRVEDETYRITCNRITIATLAILTPQTEGPNLNSAAHQQEKSAKLPLLPTEGQSQNIRTLLLQGEWPSALALAKASSTEGALLHYRYQQLATDLGRGLVSQEAYQQVFSRIAYAALELCSPEGTTSQPLTDPQNQQLRKLMEQDQWVALLALGSEWSDHFLLLLLRYRELQRLFSLGTIPQTDYRQYLKAIQQDVEKRIGDV